MKVIKVGKEPEQVMRVTCEQCGAELEIAPWDLRNERISIRNVSTYICPCCLYLNFLENGFEYTRNM